MPKPGMEPIRRKALVSEQVRSRAMIDGLYIRHALRNQIPDAKDAEHQVINYLDQILDRK